MTQRHPGLEPFEALIGKWATEATHPMMEGVVVPGTMSLEWLEGGHYLVQRIRNDHEAFPDAICVTGAPEGGDGLVMEYFDSRGVRRTYGIGLEDGVLRMWRDDPGLRAAVRGLPRARRVRGPVAGRRDAGRLARRPARRVPPGGLTLSRSSRPARR
jgi:hypothetical protein